MLNVIARFKEAARKQVLYRRTRQEIENMPLDIALDLGIYRGDADRIARDAVYGY